LESVLHKHADRLHLPVQFKRNRLELDTDDFLNPFENRFDHLLDLQKKAHAKGLIAELRFIRRTVLNAYAHADEISEDEITGEVDHGIEVVHQFEAFLDTLEKEDFATTASPLAVPHWLVQARQHAASGNHAAVKHSMRQATELFVAEYAESIGLKIPFKRSPSFSDLFRAVFPEDAMDAAEKRAFHPLIPYFFGNYALGDFDQARFDETIRLILHTGYGRLMHLLTRHGQPPPTPPAP
jgi:hypothetical protein